MRLGPLALVAWISVAAGCLSHHEYRHIYSLDGAVDVPTQAGAVAERPVIQLERVLIRDAAGIPHIYAQNRLDLARALVKNGQPYTDPTGTPPLSL